MLNTKDAATAGTGCGSVSLFAAISSVRMDRWAGWQDDAGHPGAFGDLTDDPGPDLAGALHLWEPASRSDEELIDRIGSWEKITAWAQAGQLADIAELARRRRHSHELARADHAARGGHGEPGQLMEFLVDEIALAARTSRVAAGNRLDLAQDLVGAARLVETLARSVTGAEVSRLIDSVGGRLDGMHRLPGSLDQALDCVDVLTNRVLVRVAGQTLGLPADDSGPERG